jgi:hypothetical protein
MNVAGAGSGLIKSWAKGTLHLPQRASVNV